MSASSAAISRSHFESGHARYLKQKAACQQLGIPTYQFEEVADNLLFEIAERLKTQGIDHPLRVRAKQQPDGSFKLVVE